MSKGVLTRRTGDGKRGNPAAAIPKLRRSFGSKESNQSCPQSFGRDESMLISATISSVSRLMISFTASAVSMGGAILSTTFSMMQRTNSLSTAVCVGATSGAGSGGVNSDLGSAAVSCGGRLPAGFQPRRPREELLPAWLHGEQSPDELLLSRLPPMRFR